MRSHKSRIPVLFALALAFGLAGCASAGSSSRPAGSTSTRIVRAELAELPEPVAGPGELLVEVELAGVNFADIVLVRGNYQEKPELPFAPGLEARARSSRSRTTSPSSSRAIG